MTERTRGRGAARAAGRGGRARRRPGPVPAALAALCLAAGGACGHDPAPPPATVALVPTAAAPTRWAWNATCRVGPAAPAGCEAAAPLVGTAQLAGNAWNLGGDAGVTGAVHMATTGSGRVEVTGDLSGAPPCTDPSCVAPEANTWVRGYPSVLYGIDQCHAATSPPQSPLLRLPMRLDTIPPSLVGTTSYRVDAATITHTVAYDLWLNPSDTATPCQTDGTLEVMVWTDHDAASRLPDSMRSANASIPFAVDGVAQDGADAWAVYATNVFPGGRTQPWGGTVWLVLDDAHRVTDGTVSVDLSVALDAVGGLVRDVYGWSDFATTYWLDTIAFGIEYGPAGGDVYGGGPVDFSLELSSFCLATGTSVDDARC